MVTKKWTVFLSDEKEIECHFLISGKTRFYVYVVMTTLYFKHLSYLDLPFILKYPRHLSRLVSVGILGKERETGVGKLGWI